MTLQRRAIAGAEPDIVPPLVYEVLRSPGRPLEPATRAFFEPRFGHDFSQVRVHTDEQAAASACSVNALAYTVGGDIVLGKRQYAPTSDWGQALLAHELSHVVQQEGHGPFMGNLALRLGAPGDQYEVDASRVAGLVLQAGPSEHFNPKQNIGSGSPLAAPGKPLPGVQHSPVSYIARQCLNPDICARNKTKTSCLPVSCGYGGTGTCSWPSIAIGCCCLGAKERKPPVVIPAREPEKKTSNEEAERKLRELLPTAIFVLISVALLALLIACFATGVCEAAIILAGATAAVALIIIGVLRHAGVDIRGAPGPPTA